MDAKQEETSKSWIAYVPYMIFLTFLFSLLGLGLNAWRSHERPRVAAIEGAIWA